MQTTTDSQSRRRDRSRLRAQRPYRALTTVAAALFGLALGCRSPQTAERSRPINGGIQPAAAETDQPVRNEDAYRPLPRWSRWLYRHLPKAPRIPLPRTDVEPDSASGLQSAAAPRTLPDQPPGLSRR